MFYNIYTLYTNKKLNICSYKNKATAIQEAREFAVEEKQSTIVKAGLNATLNIAICEFPNHLRELNLTTKDITVVRLDKDPF